MDAQELLRNAVQSVFEDVGCELGIAHCPTTQKQQDEIEKHVQGILNVMAKWIQENQHNNEPPTYHQVMRKEDNPNPYNS